jgi:hypothetical protein
MTGKLGDVMKESAQAAVSYVRSRATTLNRPRISMRSGSAYSYPRRCHPQRRSLGRYCHVHLHRLRLTSRPVYRDMAMTGEITLRGRVLPIGGLKEKILAAHRGGSKRCLSRRKTRKDLKDIPKVICQADEIVPGGTHGRSSFSTPCIHLKRGKKLFLIKRCSVSISYLVRNPAMEHSTIIKARCRLEKIFHSEEFFCLTVLG